jgi:hypothetical protein
MRPIKWNGTFAEQVSVPILPSGLFPCKAQKRQETFCNDPKRRGTECYGISP